MRSSISQLTFFHFITSINRSVLVLNMIRCRRSKNCWNDAISAHRSFSSNVHGLSGSFIPDQSYQKYCHQPRFRFNRLPSSCSNQSRVFCRKEQKTAVHPIFTRSISKMQSFHENVAVWPMEAQLRLFFTVSNS